MPEHQNEISEEKLLLLEWERAYTIREKPPHRTEGLRKPLNYQSFIEGVEYGEDALGISISNNSDFLSYLWETRTKNLLWKPRRRLLFLAIMWYFFWTWIFWLLYLAGVGVLGAAFFLLVSDLWYLKIFEFLIFVVVSFLLSVGFYIEYLLHIEYKHIQRLTSACVSDKWLYLEGLQKKLFKLVVPALVFSC